MITRELKLNLTTRQKNLLNQWLRQLIGTHTLEHEISRLESSGGAK